MKRSRAIIFGALAVALIIAFGLMSGMLTFKKPAVFQKGMNYTTWSMDRFLSEESDASLKKLAETGNEWVAIVVNWYQSNCESTEIFPTERTPSDEGIIHAIDAIHGLGMKVMLKPHIDVLSTSRGTWRGEIRCINDENWGRWFDSYGNMIVHYAKMAEEQKVEMYCIGVELTSVATRWRDLWKRYVIEPVRSAYHGPIVYAANWDEEYKHVTFWDLVDYVGIDAYFPLSTNKRPTLDEIKEGWKPWVEEIEKFQATVQKPIIFPEIGYCSALGVAREPWIEVVIGELDLGLQADCYEAALQTFWQKEWFYGIYWWRWGTDVNVGGMTNRGYSPQGKLAEETLKRWYTKPSPTRNPALLKKGSQR